MMFSVAELLLLPEQVYHFVTVSHPSVLPYFSMAMVGLIVLLGKLTIRLSEVLVNKTSAYIEGWTEVATFVVSLAFLLVVFATPWMFYKTYQYYDTIKHVERAHSRYFLYGPRDEKRLVRRGRIIAKRVFWDLSSRTKSIYWDVEIPSLRYGLGWGKYREHKPRIFNCKWECGPTLFDKGEEVFLSFNFYKAERDGGSEGFIVGVNGENKGCIAWVNVQDQASW